MFTLGLNGATLPNADLLTAIEAAKKAGFALYEPRVNQLYEAASYNEDEKIQKALDTSGLAWLPLNALEGVFEFPLDPLPEHVDQVLSLAERFGVTQVILVPGKPSRKITPSVTPATLSCLIDRARLHRVSLLYELIGFPTHAFPSLEQAYAVASNVGTPLVLDTFHLAVSRASPQEIASLSAEAIGLVHLSDALTEGRAPEDLLDQDRVLPGEGGLPLVDILEAIASTGYQGPVSVEVFHPRYRECDPYEVAQEAYRRTEEVLQASGWPV